jgi:putative MATE family efflux protein
VYICTILTTLAAVVFLLFGRSLGGLYLQGDGNSAEAVQTLDLAMEYLLIMTVGLFPFAVSGAYSSTLRESGQTLVPMIASISAVFTNTTLNYILIFGKFGAPALGVRGAAIATVASRFVELAIVAGWTHLNPKKNPFIVGAFRSLYIPGWLLRDITKKGLPLLLNETLFSTGNAIINQCYSTRGLDVLPALNIVGMISQLAHMAFSGFGNATAVILGQDLGAGKKKQEIQDTNWKLIASVVMLSLFSSCVCLGLSGIFPLLYNTTDSVRKLATQLTLVYAVMVIFNAYSMVCYYAIRSGGKMLTTILYDSVPIWSVGVVLVTILSRFTNANMIVLYIAGNLMYVYKTVYGTILVRKGDWIQNLVARK